MEVIASKEDALTPLPVIKQNKATMEVIASKDDLTPLPVIKQNKATMEVNASKEAALLTWIKNKNPDGPLSSLLDFSSVQDVLSTLHFCLKRLLEELVHEEDLRDELEEELADQICIISEKDNLILQLHHRVERMFRREGKLEKDHKAALLELQEKNQGLLHRVHEVEKQCQDLKTDFSQKEKKIDELTEENGTLSAQKNREVLLEKELNKVVTHKESLNEQVLILQGKISILEDELKNAQSQEKGEVLVPIMEREKLKQELADLTLKHSHLQETISRLENKKAEVEALLAQEKCSFKKETGRLQMLVLDLEKSINNIHLEREALQEALRTQKEMFTVQISALESDVSRLRQVEVQQTAETKISSDQQREELEGKVASLDEMVHSLRLEIQGLEVERASKQDALNTLVSELHTTKATFQKTEMNLEEHQKVVAENNFLKNEAITLKQELSEHLQAIGDLQGPVNIFRQEKIEEENKAVEGLVKIEGLQTQILDLTERISIKDEETKKCVKNELELIKEQNSDINELIESNHKEREETVKKLQQELDSTASVVLEKQEEILFLSAEVTSCKEQICQYSQNEAQRQQELSVLEAHQKVLKENLCSIQNQLAQRESELLSLQKEVCEQVYLKEKAQKLERDVGDLQAKFKEVSTLASERESHLISLNDELNNQHLQAKQSEDDLRRVLEEKIEDLQGKLEDKDQFLKTLDQKLKHVELLCQQKEKDLLKIHLEKKDMEKNKHQLDGYQQNLEMLRQEKDHLRSLNQTIQRECEASRKIRAELELKVEEQTRSIFALKKASQQLAEQNLELLEQLKTKSKAVENYKAQEEKAKNHYSGKKQLLLDTQAMNKTLEGSLEASKREVKSLNTKLTLARKELDQANAKEKSLAAKLKTLEAQVEFNDRHLRGKRMMGDGVENKRHKEHTSKDNLEFELNNSLNTNGRSAEPGESSTPLVRSSERLAVKCHSLGDESLYFTPMSQQSKKQKKVYHNDAFERKLESSITVGDLEVGSVKKRTASARRQCTKEVINVTMAKRTEGCSESKESLSSLHSARSQPNLATHHSSAISTDLLDYKPTTTFPKADPLQNLPGYRRKNKPEHAGNDWRRIAELQARNKACLPHLKSSYPLESGPSLGPSFTITDEDLRMGDPKETIRRASMMPGQIQKSETNVSQGPGCSQPQHTPKLPGQIRSSTAAHQGSQLSKTSSHIQASENKRSPLALKHHGSQLQDPDTHEAKKFAKCSPQPKTPKGRSAKSQNRPPALLDERRRSVTFTIVNTPKKSGQGNSRLQRPLNGTASTNLPNAKLW